MGAKPRQQPTTSDAHAPPWLSSEFSEGTRALARLRFDEVETANFAVKLSPLIENRRDAFLLWCAAAYGDAYPSHSPILLRNPPTATDFRLAATDVSQAAMVDIDALFRRSPDRADFEENHRADLERRSERDLKPTLKIGRFQFPKKTYLCLIPVPSWQLAYFFSGAVNLRGFESAAVLQHWERVAGARMLYGGDPSVHGEMFAPSLPPDANAMRELVAQIYLYCPEIVEFGDMDIGGAVDMVVSHDWWFWWD